MKYTMHRDCIECLEHFLLFLDVGLSNTTAEFFVGLWHVTQDPAHFGKFARLYCMQRYEAALDADFDNMLHTR